LKFHATSATFFHSLTTQRCWFYDQVGVAGVVTVRSTMAPSEENRLVHSIFRSKTNLTQDSSEGESGRDRNAVASALPAPVETRRASTRSMPSPSKMRGGLTVRGRRLKQFPCLAIDTTPAKDNDDVVSDSRLVKRKASWNRDTACVEQNGWIPAKIRELGTGRVALLQPLTVDELVERQSRRTRKKQPENVNDWLGRVITTQSKNPSSPAMSALTTDSEANPKIWPLRLFRRRRAEE
jgi:hypothetical protein